jgi:hypothetical protein
MSMVVKLPGDMWGCLVLDEAGWGVRKSLTQDGSRDRGQRQQRCVVDLTRTAYSSAVAGVWGGERKFDRFLQMT